MKIIIQMLIAFLALPSCGGIASDKLSAAEVLKKVEKTYVKCKSYVDTGTVTTIKLDQNGEQMSVEKREFSTAFTRPAMFRFEHNQNIKGRIESRYIVWGRLNEVKTFWKLGKMVREETPESLGMGIAGATGVSDGSAHSIPRLLIPEIGGRSVTSMKAPTFLAEKKDDDGFSCHLIKSGETILWIRKKSLLISKIQESIRFHGYNADKTTIYKPKINIDIPDEKLKYNASSDED